MNRPSVILNAAMTVDGKISTKSGDSRISCDEDLDRIHRLRADVDAVMIGVGTVLADDPVLTVRRADGENPIRVIVDSKGSTPTEARVLDDSAETMIAASKMIPDSEVERLQSRGARVLIAGSDWVDLASLLGILKEEGIDRVLLEGGSTLNWSMLSQGFVDELKIAVRTCVVGGKDAKTLVDGAGFGKVSDGLELNLRSTRRVGEDFLMEYSVKGSSDDQENRR